MSETAEILRHATEKSLIVVDEVGRGTSTYDGLSIAWALVEHFVKKTKALTLFSTHYHELIEVAEGLPQAKNFSAETSVKDGHVNFLYQIVEKGASQSYGIYVAKLAGLPRVMLNRAESLLRGLEQNAPTVSSQKTLSTKKNKKKKRDSSEEIQLCFFPTDDSSDFTDLENSVESCQKDDFSLLRKLEKDLLEVDIMNMTPLQAMEKLYELKKRVIIH